MSAQHVRVGSQSLTGPGSQERLLLTEGMRADADVLQKNIRLMQDYDKQIRRFQAAIDAQKAHKFIVLAVQMLNSLRINCTPCDYMKLYSIAINSLTNIVFCFTELSKAVGGDVLYNSVQMVSPLVPRLYLMACAANAYMNVSNPSQEMIVALFQDILDSSNALCSFKGLFFREFVLCILKAFIDQLPVNTAVELLTDNFAECTVIAHQWLTTEKENATSTSIHVVFQMLGNAISKIACIEQVTEKSFKEVVLPQVTQQIILMKNTLKTTNSAGRSHSQSVINPQGYLLNCLIRSFPSSLLHSGIDLLFDTFVRVSDTLLVKLMGSLIIRLTEYMVGNEREDRRPSPSLFEFLCKQVCSICVLGLLPTAHALVISRALLPMGVLIENNAEMNNERIDMMTPWLNSLQTIAEQITNNKNDERTLQGALYSYVQLIRNRPQKTVSLPLFSKVVVSLPEGVRASLADTLLDNIVNSDCTYPLESIVPVIKLSHEGDRIASALHCYKPEDVKDEGEYCEKQLALFDTILEELGEGMKDTCITTIICILQERRKTLMDKGEAGLAGKLGEYCNKLFPNCGKSLVLKIRYGAIEFDEIRDTVFARSRKSDLETYREKVFNMSRNNLFSYYLNTVPPTQMATIVNYVCSVVSTEGLGLVAHRACVDSLFRLVGAVDSEDMIARLKETIMKSLSHFPSPTDEDTYKTIERDTRYVLGLFE